MVESYLFEVTDNKLKEVQWRLIYRDNRLLVFKGSTSMCEIRIWRDILQEKVCSIPGSLYTAGVAPYQSMIGLGPLNKSRQTRHSLGLV